MATRWSRAHGESYLRRKWSGGGVEDVERLTMVLWFRGIGQRRSVLVVLARRRHGVLVAVRAEEGEGMQKWNGRLGGQALGASRRGWPCQGVRGAWPARSGERRRVAPHGQQPLNLSATTLLNRFRKKHDSVILTMTDRAGMTMISS